MKSESPVLPLGRLVKGVQKLKGQGKRIAFTNGCFDILHAGHLDYLEKVKAHADVLIVAVNSDASVRRLKKGSGRPIVPARERARLVAALKPVDYVTIFSEDTPLKIIRALRPDVLAKGGDWKPEAVVGREVVQSTGAKILIVPYLKGHSTTRLLGRIKKT